jgi:hypothetical protein
MLEHGFYFSAFNIKSFFFIVQWLFGIVAQNTILYFYCKKHILRYNKLQGRINMEQAIILIMSFLVPGILVCIIGIIYALYDDKRKAAQST